MTNARSATHDRSLELRNPSLQWRAASERSSTAAYAAGSAARLATRAPGRAWGAGSDRNRAVQTSQPASEAAELAAQLKPRFERLAAQPEVPAMEALPLAAAMVDLLASLRLSSMAASLAARLSRCARASGDTSTAVVAHLLALVHQVDPIQALARSLRLPVAPIRQASSKCAASPKAALATAALLHDAARRARALGHESLSRRAQFAAEVLSFEIGSSDVRALRRVATDWQRGAMDGAHDADARDSEYAIGWVALASQIAGDTDALPFGLRQRVTEDDSPDALLIQATHHWLSGRPAAAIETYADYAAANVATVESAEKLRSSGLPALAELVLARVGTPARVPSADEIRNVTAFLSTAMTARSEGNAAALAERCGLSLRRVQQSFSGCGLPAPATFLRSFWV